MIDVAELILASRWGEVSSNQVESRIKRYLPEEIQDRARDDLSGARLWIGTSGPHVLMATRTRDGLAACMIKCGCGRCQGEKDIAFNETASESIVSLIEMQNPPMIADSDLEPDPLSVC